MENFTIEKYAVEIFTQKYGSNINTRFDKLKEEFDELIEARDKYFSCKCNLERVLDEISDVEAVLSHIRSIISNKSHEESILDALLKSKIREHNKNYKKL